MTESKSKTSPSLPLIPLRDVVVYPQMVIPLFVGREKSVNAIKTAAAKSDKQILLVAQHEAEDDDPVQDKLYEVGTLATILQFLKLPDGTLKILVEGQERVVLSSIRDSAEGDYWESDFRVLEQQKTADSEAEVLITTLRRELEEYASMSKKLPKEVMASLQDIKELPVLADSIAMHMPFELETKQQILEITDVAERVSALLELVDSEVDLQRVEKRIRSRVKKQMEKSQREYYLNEQMKAIQKELGDIDGESDEFSLLESKIVDAGMPEKAKEKADSELAKLKMMSPMSAEASVIRNYIDWMVSVPWAKRSKVRHDLARAETMLERDHYGLEEVKERILEFLAVQKRVKKLKGPILCLVGPPGVGKTSLGESIAKATNREFVRMSLGGVRDEAEIRGHRRTYIGSMPGKLIQKLSKVEVNNPLFLLDEVDKLGMDYRGDPSSALLEVLDPEQNSTFNDHYLEVDFDLSDVMFVCTANSMNIPGPLLDRMEVIRIPGYTEDEKYAIASRYLIPKQSKANGLKKDELELPESAIRRIVREYTREAGVRGLEREIAKICRKVVTKNTRGSSRKASKLVIEDELLEEFLGVPKYTYGTTEETNRIGQVTGLAWTQVGGELLTIEASCVPGSGKIVKTGSLGDVMQESIQAALTVVRGRAQALGIDPDFYTHNDLHIHIPEGATPKDGPSAGVGMVTALVSELTKIPVRSDVAMTGEITLRGEVLSIGGMKEKLLAAHRGGIKTVIIPEGNEKNISEIPDNIKQDLSIKTARWIDEVLEIALESVPIPLEDKSLQKNQKEADTDASDSVRPSTH
jgi:ATP-dependent Lon protease